jgi:multisubunit Na+/H+ antiporter MnhE subunit
MLLWVLVTSTFQGAELVAGAIASVLSAVAVEAVRERERFVFRPRLRWVRRAFVIPARVVADTWLLTVALVRHVSGSKRVRGAFVAVPFRHGEPGDPEDSARRALVVAGLSVAPNSVVVGVDDERDEVLVHQLVPDAAGLLRDVGG